MDGMSNGDPTTAPNAIGGPIPLPPVPPSHPYPAGPPTAVIPGPPTAVNPSVSMLPPPLPPGGFPNAAGGHTPTPQHHGPGRGRGVAITLLLVFALLAGLAGGYGLAHIGRSTPVDSASPPESPTVQVPSAPSTTLPADPVAPGSRGGVDPTDPSGSGQGSQTPSTGPAADVDKVAAAVTPGVVNINVLTGQGQGAGTGMILTSDGLVLTNNHVVRGATRIVVIDADSGDRYDAKVLGTAPTKDVALIRLVGAKGLATVRTGNSDTVKVGDSVVALGNAGGRGGTPTVVPGNVVALGRSITASDESGQGAQRLNNLIQTDANIVPGDSGGPLANAKGEVIAVNSAASVTNQTAATGEGYAIPINDALRIVDQIKAGAASDVVHIGTRGVLGVQVSSVAADPFGSNGTGQAVEGAAVAGVADGSGAQKAGVAAGSTITALNGRKVTSAEGLTNALSNAKPGDRVSLTWTDAAGQSRTATVTLTEGPPD